MRNQECAHKGCNKPAHPAMIVYGRIYCDEHYRVGVEEAFQKELSTLGQRKPSRKFRNLFGRYIEGIYQSKAIPMPEELRGSKLRDRADNIELQGKIITFNISRHPRPIPIVQYWIFDLDQQMLSLADELPAYLDCNEVAVEVGLTPQTIRSYIRIGTLKAIRAEKVEEICDWFDDKYRRGHQDIYMHMNSIINPRKWLVSQKELRRFKGDRERNSKKCSL